MKLRSVVGTAIGVLCQLAAIPVASADPVTITSGFAVINLTRLPRGSVELQGTGGFTFVGDIGFSAARPECMVCVPGEVLPLRTNAVGTDLVGSVRRPPRFPNLRQSYWLSPASPVSRWGGAENRRQSCGRSRTERQTATT